MNNFFLNLLDMKTIKKVGLFQFALFFLLSLNVNGQTGLNFQGVARNSNNIILASQPITIRLSILRDNLDATKTEEYIETRRVMTNAQGLFTAVIGDTGAISSLGIFTNINWKLTPKFLKIEMDPNGGANFTTIGTTQFQLVAYAQYAKSVDAENIIGVVPIAMGGTGVNSLTGLKSALVLDNVNNTSDLNKPISTPTQTALDLKVDKLIGKMLSSNDYTDNEKTKLAAISGQNTGDQDLSTYATITSVALKENSSNKSNDTELGGTTPSDILFPTQKAVKAFVAANSTSGGVSDASITTVKLADLTVTDAKVAAGINKSKVGLSNVDNTSDASKPVSTAAQIALDLKAPLISPSFTTPSLGAATATSIISGNLTLTTALSVANGGTGTSSLTANNILLGDGINALKFVPPGANGNVLTSNGTTWVSAAASTATKPSYQNKFLSTGSYTVPNGVNTLLIEFNGAVGGNGADLEVMNQYSAGCVNPYSVAGGGQSGKANKISALLLVNAGDIISFTLGQNGSKPTTERTPCYPGYTYGTGSYGSYYASNGSAGATSSFSINGNLILSLSSSDVGSGAYNNQGQTQARTPSTSTVNGSSTYNNNFDNYSITILSDAASNETTPYFKIKH